MLVCYRSYIVGNVFWVWKLPIIMTNFIAIIAADFVVLFIERELGFLSIVSRSAMGLLRISENG